jgi:hypothetical protein
MREEEEKQREAKILFYCCWKKEKNTYRTTKDERCWARCRERKNGRKRNRRLEARQIRDSLRIQAI